MTKKERAMKAIERAYDQMCKESSSNKSCVSNRARREIREELKKSIAECSERFQLTRLCMLVLKRMDEPRRFDIANYIMPVPDLDLMDAAHDYVAYGENLGEWEITPEMEMKWS